MKKQKLAFLLIAIFIGLNSFSQIIYVDNKSNKLSKWNNPYSIQNRIYYGDGINYKLFKEFHVAEQDISILKYKRKGTRAIEKSRVIRSFNKKTTLTEYFSFHKGKEFSHNIYQYDANNNRIDYKRRYKGKNYLHSINKYNYYNQLIQRDSYYNNKFRSRAIAVYQDSIITAQWTYYKDSSNIRYKWEYNYYPNWDKKTTKYYKKGVLEHTWNYTCDEEGKEEKPKDETKVCELKQYNADSSYVIIRRLTDEKEKISKRRFTYDKNGNRILKEYFNIKGKLTDKDSSIYLGNKQLEDYQFYRNKHSNKIQKTTIYQFDKEGNKKSLIKTEYKKSGSIAWVHEYKFNSAGKKLESIFYGKNKKLISIKKYTYNEDNKQTESVTLNADGSLKYKSTYEYNKKGLLTRSDSYNKKNILVRSVITKYQYY